MPGQPTIAAERQLHKVPRTDAVRKAQRACRLDTAANVLDLGLDALLPALGIQLAKVPSRKDLEAGDDLLADEILDRLDVASLGHLDLQLALSELELERLRDESVHVCFRNHVLARDAEVDVTLADEARDVGRREEDAASGRR